MKLSGCLVLLLLAAPSPAGARCLAYEPSVVSLVGKLASKTVPGPPNYTSIARGDLPEVVFTLHLEAPVCVSANPTSTLNSASRSGILEVQLVIPVSRARPWVGKRVRATGSLFKGHTGHHRTPVILHVSALRAT